MYASLQTNLCQHFEHVFGVWDVWVSYESFTVISPLQYVMKIGHGV